MLSFSAFPWSNGNSGWLRRLERMHYCINQEFQPITMSRRLTDSLRGRGADGPSMAFYMRLAQTLTKREWLLWLRNQGYTFDVFLLMLSWWTLKKTHFDGLAYASLPAYRILGEKNTSSVLSSLGTQSSEKSFEPSLALISATVTRPEICWLNNFIAKYIYISIRI